VSIDVSDLITEATAKHGLTVRAVIERAVRQTWK
jgi:hypothetical protein